MGIWNVNPIIYSGLVRVLIIEALLGCDELVPKIVIFKTCPQSPRCNRLSVVHTTFAGVFSNYSVDNNLLLPGQRVSHTISWPVLGGSEADLSVNQPFFPLNQLAVWQGPGGIRRKEKMPIKSVSRP